MAIQYNSNYHETMPFSDAAYQLALTANNAQSITIQGLPNTKYQAYFSFNDEANVFVRLNAPASVPADNTVNTEQYNELRPLKRYVQTGDVLHFITPDTNAYVGVSLRQIQS